MIAITLVVVSFIFMLFRRSYVDAICYDWNGKLFKYEKYLELNGNISEKKKKYLNQFYIMHPEDFWFQFRIWKEKDIIEDKILLQEVNKYEKDNY
ncbi:MAG: hypothetical protein ACW99F_19160 [Candidatus Hodarchaeales archaeon]